MDDWVSVLCLVGVGSLLAILGFRSRKRKDDDVESPPPNRAADAANDTIQQTFQDEVSGILKRARGKDPAGDLADKGNSRNRR
tara:strand:- start:676 stop:924 length:249 start_codon:yes stop_codon:yes gene_type:complete